MWESFEFPPRSNRRAWWRLRGIANFNQYSEHWCYENSGFCSNDRGGNSDFDWGWGKKWDMNKWKKAFIIFFLFWYKTILFSGTSLENIPITLPKLAEFHPIAQFLLKNTKIWKKRNSKQQTCHLMEKLFRLVEKKGEKERKRYLPIFSGSCRNRIWFCHKMHHVGSNHEVWCSKKITFCDKWIFEKFVLQSFRRFSSTEWWNNLCSELWIIERKIRIVEK